jgi:hypothetical protein
MREKRGAVVFAIATSKIMFPSQKSIAARCVDEKLREYSVRLIGPIDAQTPAIRGAFVVCDQGIFPHRNSIGGSVAI